MIFQYYPDTDMLYIELARGVSTESEEVEPGIVLDFDENDRVIGIEPDLFWLQAPIYQRPKALRYVIWHQGSSGAPRFSSGMFFGGLESIVLSNPVNFKEISY